MEGKTLARWLVTCAWPYVSYSPHLGNLIGSVLSADVYARYLRLKGEEVLFVSGSDEHGTPIEVEAIKRGVSPSELSETNHLRFLKLWKDWWISFDNYSKTESPTHKEFVRDFYSLVEKNGYIYSEEVELTYCETDKRYLPDRFVEGRCPYCGFEGARGDQCDNCGRLLEPTKLIEPYCVICKTKPIVKETKHWFFNLPKFESELRTFLKSNQHLPENARSFSLGILNEGLQPRSVTRDNAWGIPAPFKGAEGKTIYVWLEAVLGYISATKEYTEQHGKGEDWKHFWFEPKTRILFFIGKDNITFHTLILPALLLATKKDYTLPWNVPSTEYLIFEGEKFSKSKRTGVWIDEALSLYPVDYWRFWLIANRPELKDSGFTWEGFADGVNSILNDTIGNFIHRTLVFIQRNFNAEVPKPGKFNQEDESVLAELTKCKEETSALLDDFKLKDSLARVTGLARSLNKYLNDAAPWQSIKKHPTIASTTLYVAIQGVRALAILLSPFIPSTSNEIWGQLALKGQVGSSEWKTFNKKLESGHKLGDVKPLFSKIGPGEIDSKLQELEKVRTVSVSKQVVSKSDFDRLDLRVAEVVKAERIPGKDKLLRLEVKVGVESRQVVAGIAQHYAPEALVGKRIIVVFNLEPAKIAGLSSEAMLLATEDKGRVVLVSPERPVEAGAIVR